MSDLNVSVILQAVDKMTAPVRQITKATKNLGVGFGDVEKRYGELSQKTRQVDTFANLKRKVNSTHKEFTEATKKVGTLAREIANTSKPTKQLTRQFEQAKRRAALLKTEHLRQGQELHKLRMSLKDAGISTRNLGQEQRQLKQQLGDVTGALREQERRLQKITKLQAPVAETQNRIQANLDRRANLRGQMLDAAALGIAFAVPIKAAIDFESVMADVKKVVDFDTPQQFKKMGTDILTLSTRMPMAASGLADIVAAAGQAGIARHELLRFAEDAAKMGVAFDMAGKEAGAAMTGLRSIFKLNQDQVVGLGDAYNHLANNMDARASDLLEIANRSGSTAKLFGLTGQQLGALGATFKALKTPTEVAGTGINALLQRLATADKQPKKFREALEAIGISAEELKDSISHDAQGALLQFLESVKGSEDVMGTLSDLFGAEYADDVAKLVGGLDIYKDALNKVADSSNYSGSMLKEYQQRAKTTQNGIQLLANSLSKLGISIGSIVLPGINALVNAVGKVVNGITELSERFPLATKAIVAVTSALVIGKIAAIGFGYAWTFIKGGLLGAKLAFQKARLYVTLLNTSLVSSLKNAVPSFIAGMKAAGLAAWNFGKRGAMAAVAGSNAIKRSLIATGAAAVTFAKNPITGTVSGIKKLGLSMFGLASGGIKALARTIHE